MNREQLRLQFFDAWQKHQQQKPLTPLEASIAQAIQQHPEYRSLIESLNEKLDKEFLPELGESNPILHLSLHMSIQEQIKTDRPAGIASIYQQMTKHADVHDVEHAMMEVLAESLWEAQRNQRLPDEQVYLAKLKRLVR